MSKKEEITFMQIRLIRLASEEWHLSIDKIIEIFKNKNVFSYIETRYGIFHCEGDDVVLEDVGDFLMRKGIDVYAGIN